MFDIDTATGEMFLYDEIGPGYMGMIDGSTVIAALAKYKKKQRVTARINSPGGSVDEAIAIYNALERHPGGVDVIVDSLAASAASYIAMVGERISIAANAAIMIHSPWTLAVGNADELRRTADLLDKYESRLVQGYGKRMQISDEEVSALLMAETWYVGGEAVEAKLADEVSVIVREPATVAEGRYAKTPHQFLAKVQPGTRTKSTIAKYQALAAKYKNS